MANIKIVELENNLTDLNEENQALVIGGFAAGGVFAASENGAAGSFAGASGDFSSVFTLANVTPDIAGAQVILNP